MTQAQATAADLEAAADADADESHLVDSVTEPGPGLEPEDPAQAPAPAAPDATAPTPAATSDPVPSTRDRILDAALDLFIDQGFDGTSLREIAERLGITKAALYYHFESKDDILMALHMRLHALGRDTFSKLGDGPVTLEQWRATIDEVLDTLPAQRKVFLLHERNQAAMEKLHREAHSAEHMDMQEQFRKVLADTRVPFADRVRMAASLGVVFSSVFLSGDDWAGGSDEELGSQLREILHDVLGG
jgi:AcrR family transcriptional regulator